MLSICVTILSYVMTENFSANNPGIHLAPGHFQLGTFLVRFFVCGFFVAFNFSIQLVVHFFILLEQSVDPILFNSVIIAFINFGGLSL